MGNLCEILSYKRLMSVWNKENEKITKIESKNQVEIGDLRSSISEMTTEKDRIERRALAVFKTGDKTRANTIVNEAKQLGIVIATKRRRLQNLLNTENIIGMARDKMSSTRTKYEGQLVMDSVERFNKKLPKSVDEKFTDNLEDMKDSTEDDTDEIRAILNPVDETDEDLELDTLESYMNKIEARANYVPDYKINILPKSYSQTYMPPQVPQAETNGLFDIDEKKEYNRNGDRPDSNSDTGRLLTNEDFETNSVHSNLSYVYDDNHSENASLLNRGPIRRKEIVLFGDD